MPRHAFHPPDVSREFRRGLAFAHADYMALADHPALRDSRRDGDVVRALEDRLARFLQFPVAATFASGTEAMRQSFGRLLRPGDHVILDSAAHPALFQAASLAQARIHRSPSASVEGIQRRLARLSRDRGGRLVVAVPAVSAQTSRIADLAELSVLTRQHGALLVVDVSHDFGTMAPLGGGVAEIQACLPRIDILLGSLTRSFATPAGFAVFRNPDLFTPLRPEERSAAFAPHLAARALAALDIVAGPEGARRRRKLHGLSLRLRNHLMADGLRPLGQASPFVTLLLPPLTALPRTALLESAGPRVDLLQAPRVGLHAPRWRFHLSAAHSPADIDDLAELVRDVTRAFDRVASRMQVPA